MSITGLLVLWYYFVLQSLFLGFKISTICTKHVIQTFKPGFLEKLSPYRKKCFGHVLGCGAGVFVESGSVKQKVRFMDVN